MLINRISFQEAKALSAIEHIFITENGLYKAASDTVQEKNANPTYGITECYGKFDSGSRRGTVDLESIMPILR